MAMAQTAQRSTETRGATKSTGTETSPLEKASLSTEGRADSRRSIMTSALKVAKDAQDIAADGLSKGYSIVTSTARSGLYGLRDWDMAQKIGSSANKGVSKVVTSVQNSKVVRHLNTRLEEIQNDINSLTSKDIAKGTWRAATVVGKGLFVGAKVVLITAPTAFAEGLAGETKKQKTDNAVEKSKDAKKAEPAAKTESSTKSAEETATTPRNTEEEEKKLRNNALEAMKTQVHEVSTIADPKLSTESIAIDTSGLAAYEATAAHTEIIGNNPTEQIITASTGAADVASYLSSNEAGLGVLGEGVEDSSKSEKEE